MTDPSRHQNQDILTVRLAGLRLKLAALRLRLKANFNPNQPRVPAGDPEGGQWIDGGASTSAKPSRLATAKPSAQRKPQVVPAPSRTAIAGATSERVVRDHTGEQPWSSHVSRYRSDGSLASRTVSNRDGSKVDSDFSARGIERHTVTLPDGPRFTFENIGDTQRILDAKDRLLSETFWTDQGPVAQPFVRPVLYDPLKDEPFQPIKPFEAMPQFGAGIALFGALLSLKEPSEEVIFGFDAEKVRSSGKDGDIAPYAARRNRKEAENACPKLPTVQRIVDEAATVHLPNMYRHPSIRGTAIHVTVKNKINGPGKQPLDPNFMAEVSAYKSGLEAALERNPYGAAGTIRIDVFERQDNNIICVYDLKTGQSGLTMRRMEEIARAVSNKYQYSTIVMIIEVRPAK